MIGGARATTLPTGTVPRRRVLLAGAVGAGALLVRPGRAGATLSERVHRDVRELMVDARLPGLSAAIVRGQEVVWTDVWGLANIKEGRRVTPDTLFMLASVSKTVVATAVLQAIEDGLFELDTPVNRLLPFFVRNPVHPEEPITVRQLLTHTSSIRDNWNLLIDSYVRGDAEMALGTFLRRYLAPTGADLSPNNYYSFGPGRSYRSGPRARARPGPDLVEFQRGGRMLVGHDGGDDGAATVCFFDPADDVGVVALANGGWRTIQGDWSLYLIMDRLFGAARGLG